MERLAQLTRLALRGAIGLGLVLAPWGDAVAEVVLLTNGSVLTGVARSEGESVVVRVSADGEIRLCEADVAVVKPTLVGAYEWLREQRPAGVADADNSLDLAEWCLRQGLWPQASRELLEARSLAPESERVAMLERRLMLLSQPPEKAERLTATSEAPKSDAREIVEEQSKPSLVLPTDGLEHFAQRIQPVLVNSCTTSGCHRGGNPFELDRSPLHGYGDARSTQHNLRSALAAIDPASPTESPLLIAARGPHQGVMPIRGPRRVEVLDRLEAWVASVAAAQPAIAIAPPPVVEGAIQAASYEEPVESAREPTEPREPAQTPRIEPGGLLRPVEARDEFDPEVFNRRHRRPEDDLPLDAK